MNTATKYSPGKRCIVFLLAFVMLFSSVPTVVVSGEAAPAKRWISLGTAVLKEGANTANAPSVILDRDSVWKVIGYDGTGLAGPSGTVTLLPEDGRETTAFNSQFDDCCYARSWLISQMDFAGLGVFFDYVKSAARTRNLEAGSYNGAETDCISEGGVEDAALWALSTKEAGQLDPSIRKINKDWWLRSPGKSDGLAAAVEADGSVNYEGKSVGSELYIRPAFYMNLDSVLFVSAAKGENTKRNCSDDLFEVNEVYTDNEWKPTFFDSSRTGFTAAFDSRDGDVWTVKYSGAKEDDIEYISAMITDENGAVKYYGRLCLAEEGDDNTVTVDLSEIAMGAGDKLYVFNEQINADDMPDCSSALVEITAPEKVGYKLWIDGAEVTSANLSGEGWKFAPGSNTLTLDGFNYSGCGSQFYRFNNKCEAAIAYLGSKDLNITINGKNTVTQTGPSGSGILENYAFCSNDPAVGVNISGSGELILRSGASDNFNYGMFCGNLSIESGKVSVYNGSSTYTNFNVILKGSLTMTGGELTVESGNSEMGGSEALIIQKNLTVSGGKLSATGGDATDGDSIGIHIYGNVTLEGGTVFVTSSVSIGGQCYGIYAEGKNAVIEIKEGIESFVAYGDHAIGGGARIKTAVPGIGYLLHGEEEISVNTEGTVLKNYWSVEFPVTKYDIWVGGTQVSSFNCDKIPGVLGEGARAKYDPDTETLTLTNVTGVTGSYEGAAIYAKDLDLTVKGAASIMSSDPYGIMATGDCSLAFDGDITLTGKDTTVRCEGDVTVLGGHLNAGPSNNANSSHVGINASGKVTVSGGILEAGSVTGAPAIISDPAGEIVIPDTHYIRAPFDGKVDCVTDVNKNVAHISDKNGNLASSVIIAPKTYYKINLTVNDTVNTTIGEVLAGETVIPDIKFEDEVREISVVTLSYGTVSQQLYSRDAGGTLPVSFIMPDSEVTLKLELAEKIYTGLGSLTVSEGTLDPEFKTKTTGYADALGCGVAEVEVSFGVTEGRQLLLDETQFKEGSLTFDYDNSDYPQFATGATGTVVLTGSQTELKIKTNAINDPLDEVEYTVTFNRASHTLSHSDEIEPSCQKPGVKEYWECSVCHKLFSDKDAKNKIDEPEEIEKLGHKPGEWKTTKYPTLTETGMKRKYCTACGEETESEEIPELVNVFSDVADDTWYTEPAAFCAYKGYVIGTAEGQFSPELTLTRAMFIQMLARLDGVNLENISYNNEFSDVKADDWFAPAVSWGAGKGIMIGAGDGRFLPNDPISREQFVTLLYKYAKSYGYDVSAAADLFRFTDACKISEWAEDAMKWAVAEGIISGMSEKELSPDTGATRAQAAVLFRRFAEYLGK